MSLKFFYEAALLGIEESSIPAPDHEVTIENHSSEISLLKTELSQQSHKTRKVKLFRSGLRLPPSNCECALRLSEQLMETQDLSLFELTLLCL